MIQFMNRDIDYRIPTRRVSNLGGGGRRGHAQKGIGDRVGAMRCVNWDNFLRKDHKLAALIGG